MTAPNLAWDDFVGRAGRDPLEEVDRRTAELGPEDPSDILFTSGTTGSPKGVVMTHGRTLAVATDWVAMTGLSAGDVYLMVNPYFHMFGLKAGILASVAAGATMLPEPVFDADRVLARVAGERVTVLPGPPTLYQSILDHRARDDHDLSSLRVAVTGAADIPVELIRRVHDELPFSTVVTGYGLTEAGTASATGEGDDAEAIATTVGRARPGIRAAHRRPEAGRGRVGRDPGPRAQRDGEVSRRPGGDGEGALCRRLAADGRSRDARRRRAPAHRGPGQGHVHRGRVQRLPGRDRECAAAAPCRAASRRHRHTRRPPRRGRHGLRRRGPDGDGR